MPDKEVYELKLSVKVDKENAQVDLAKITSSLNQMGVQVQNVGQVTKEQQKSFSGLQGVLSGLAARWLSIGTAVYTSYNFIKNSIKAVEEQIIQNRQLDTTLKAIGLDYKELNPKINETIERLSKGTKFTKEELLKIYDTFLMRTKDVNAAFKLLIGSMDVATGTGKSLDEVANILNTTLSTQRSATLILGREFGKLGTQGKDLNEMITNLFKNFQNQRTAITDLTKETVVLEEEQKRIEIETGKTLLPLLTLLATPLKGLIGIIETIKIRTVLLFEIVSRGLGGIVASIQLLIERDLKGAGKALKDTQKDIRDIFDRADTEFSQMADRLFGKTKNTTELTKQEIDKFMQAILKKIAQGEKEIETEEDKRLHFIEKINNEIAHIENQTYQQQMENLDNRKKTYIDEAKKYKDSKDLMVLIDKWYNAEKNKIDKNFAEQDLKNKQELRNLDLNNVKDTMLKEVGSLMGAYQTDVENYEKMLKEKKISQDKFNEWIEKRTKKLNLDLDKANINFVTKWGEHSEQMKAISEAVYSSMQGVFQNFITEALKGGQHLEDAMKNLFNNILSAFVNMLTQMAAEYLAKQFIFGLTGFSVGGGLLGVITGGLQTGGIIPQTGPYIMHKGEKVIPAGSSETINNSNPTIVNLNFHTFDVRQVDRIHMERLARTMADYLKGKV